MKDVDRRRDNEDERDNTNGDDRKGESTFDREFDSPLINFALVDVGSPVPAHDELDTAE